jgi:hypothetical protein
VLFDVLGTLPLQAEVLQPAVAFDKRAAVEALAA